MVFGSKSLLKLIIICLLVGPLVRAQDSSTIKNKSLHSKCNYSVQEETLPDGTTICRNSLPEKNEKGESMIHRYYFVILICLSIGIIGGIVGICWAKRSRGSVD